MPNKRKGSASAAPESVQSASPTKKPRVSEPNSIPTANASHAGTSRASSPEDADLDSPSKLSIDEILKLSEDQLNRSLKAKLVEYIMALQVACDSQAKNIKSYKPAIAADMDDTTKKMVTEASEKIYSAITNQMPLKLEVTMGLASGWSCGPFDMSKAIFLNLFPSAERKEGWAKPERIKHVYITRTELFQACGREVSVSIGGVNLAIVNSELHIKWDSVANRLALFGKYIID